MGVGLSVVGGGESVVVSGIKGRPAKARAAERRVERLETVCEKRANASSVDIIAEAGLLGAMGDIRGSAESEGPGRDSARGDGRAGAAETREWDIRLLSCLSDCVRACEVDILPSAFWGVSMVCD